MKIAYLLDTFPAATETFIAREIEALRKRGFEIEVWALKAGDGALPIKSSVAKLMWRARDGKLDAARSAQFFQWLGMRWWHRVAGRGIEHIHAAWASHPAEIARGAARVSGKSWSFFGHARDLWVEGDDLGGKLRDAKFAACCTRAGCGLLKQSAPDAASKVIYAPHGLDLQRWPYQPARLDGPLRLLSVGRLVPKKGFDDLLRACAVLRRQGQQFSLQVVGDGPLRADLEKQRRDASLDSVSFCGMLSPHEVRALMHRANCFVLPCKTAPDGDRDGLPNVLLEAAASGLPIVAATGGSVRDFVDESVGFGCAPDDYHALQDAMRAAFQDPSRTLEKCIHARQRIEERFDIERNISVLADAFNRC